MKTFETPKVIELGTLQQIVLSANTGKQFEDVGLVPHATPTAPQAS